MKYKFNRKNNLLVLLFFSFSVNASEKPSAFKLYTTGSAIDVTTPTTQLICLAGGGDDDLWASGWKDLLNAAGGGDVVIIRAGDDGSNGGYDSWIYNDESKNGFPKVNSVKTISLTNASDANRDDVAQTIRNAEMVFFSGGDQSLYINWFKGSKLAAAVEHVMNVKKIPMGGTSAGMVLLAGIDYTSNHDSPAKPEGMVTTEDVLNNPTGKFVDLDRTVVTPPFMKNVITDTHFAERNRQGRLMGFMARAVYNNYEDVTYNNIKGIGADEGTAVCYDQVGMAKIHGSGNAYFLSGETPIAQIRTGAPLDWSANCQAVTSYVINGSQIQSAQFDLSNWRGTGGTSESWKVDSKNSKSANFGKCEASKTSFDPAKTILISAPQGQTDVKINDQRGPKEISPATVNPVQGSRATRK